MSETEYNWWSAFRERNATTIQPDELDVISAMYSRIFQKRKVYRPCTCNPNAWQEIINHLNYIYDTY